MVPNQLLLSNTVYTFLRRVYCIQDKYIGMKMTISMYKQYEWYTCCAPPWQNKYKYMYWEVFDAILFDITLLYTLLQNIKFVQIDNSCKV